MINKIKVLFLLILTACADGPAFERVQLSGDDAVVYFYRPAFFGSALPPHKIIETNTNKCVATLLPGGYFPYVTQPGEKTFVRHFRDETASINLKIEPHQEYFVESTADPWVLELRLFAPPILTQVSKEEGLKELESKKLSIVKEEVK